MKTRRDLFDKPTVWSISGPWVHDALRSASTEGNTNALPSLLSAARSDLAEEAASVFGVSKTLDILIPRIGEISNSDLDRWLSVIMKSPEAVAQLLSNARGLKSNTLVAIAHKSYPDFVPNDVGEDPWVTALATCEGTTPTSDSQILASYLLARAFGYRSHSQPQLIAFGYDTVYFAALREELSDHAWGFLDSALPQPWWFEWDRCRRLRDGVVDLFVDRDLPPGGFLNITRDNSLFEELCWLAKENSRGRKYLKKVLRYLNENAGSDSKRHTLQKIL